MIGKKLKSKPAGSRLHHASHATSVVAGIIVQSGQMLITQRLHDDAWGDYWEFPGGKVEEGESDSQALQRELWEELGIKTQTGNLAWELTHNYPTHRVFVRFYYATIVTGAPHCLEVQAFRWVDRGQLSDFRFLPSNKTLLDFLKLKK